MYLFHGGGQDHTAFMARTAFPPMARKHEFIVVMPAADRNYSVLGPEAQGRYHDYVAGELVDYVDSHYRTIATKDARAIGGLSMGGRIASMTSTDARRSIQRRRRVQPGAATGRRRRRAQRSGSGAVLLHLLRHAGLAAAHQSRVRVVADWNVSLPHDYKEAPGLGHTWVLWDEQIGVFFDLLESRGFRSAS